MSVSRETGQPGVSRETSFRLDAFARLLAKWNSRINLVSPGDMKHLWSRHINDSLQLLPWVDPTLTGAADVGSGAGFPGLVLAIATNVHFTLIEADARKAAFLREAVRLTQASATILNQRVEELRMADVDLITARALAPLPRLLDLCIPLLKPGGSLLFLKGATVESEIAEAQLAWTMRIDRHISVTGGGGVILRVSEVQRA